MPEESRVVELPLTLWRFSRRKLSTFPFALIEDQSELIEMVRSALGDTGLSERLDATANRPVGFHQRLAASSTSSGTLRALNYAADLLISSVIGHHTGRNGAIGVILDEPAVSAVRPNEYPKLPSPAQCVGSEPLCVLNIDTGKQHLLVEGHNASCAPYILALASNDLPGVSYGQRDVFRQAASLVAQFLYDSLPRRPFAMPIVLDGMLRNNHIEFFEVHIPGRSLGVHLLPAMWLSAVARDENLKAALCEVARTLVNATRSPPKYMRDDTFGVLDYRFWEWLVPGSSAPPSRTLVTEVDVALRADNNPLATEAFDRLYWRQQLDSVCACENHWRLVGPTSTVRVESALEELGPWIAIKARQNLPWWHPNQVPVRVAASFRKADVARIKKLAGIKDFVLERINVESVDKVGRSGEYRRAYLVITDGPQG